MKTESNESKEEFLRHKFENSIGLILGAIDNLEYNINDHEFCKRIIKSMVNLKKETVPFIQEVKEALGDAK